MRAPLGLGKINYKLYKLEYLYMIRFYHAVFLSQSGEDTLMGKEAERIFFEGRCWFKKKKKKVAHEDINFKLVLTLQLYSIYTY